jgi:VWFA-related protein
LRSARRLTLHLLLLIYGLHALDLPASAQSSEKTPTFHSKVRVVLVNVVVTDGKNQPVTGLQPDDFQVFDDGVPQTLASFEQSKEATPAQARLTPLPPHVYTNAPAVDLTDSVNVVLLDMLNTQLMDQAYVREQIIKYLRQIQPGSRLAIFTLTSRLHMVHRFTSDPAQLLALFTGKKGAANPVASLLLLSDTEGDSDQAQNSQMLVNGEGQALAMAHRGFYAMTQMQWEQRIRITLRALQLLGLYLSSIPGRKNVIWFAGSFPVSFFPDTNQPDPFREVRSFQKDIQETDELLTVGQVALYPIAAEGLTANPPGVSPQRANGLRAENQLAMERLAEDTGGHAFYNTNGLGMAMVTAINNGAHYYTLSYKPTDQKVDGKLHHIRIKLRHHKYHLAYRRGYYAEEANAERKLSAQTSENDDPLIPIMQLGSPDTTQVLYKIRILPLATQPPPDAPRAGSNTELKAPFTRYGVDFAIPPDSLKLNVTSDGVHHGSLEVRLMVYDAKGKPLNLVAQHIGLTLAPKVYGVFQRGGLQVHEDIDVPAGRTYLTTGIYDWASRRAGSLEIPLNTAGLAKTGTGNVPR